MFNTRVVGKNSSGISTVPVRLALVLKVYVTLN